MNNQFYDLNIETLDDGTIRLEQRDYCGESVILDLHPAQVAYIADSLTVNTPERIQTQPNWAKERIATLERRMHWMRDRFEECHEVLPSDMLANKDYALHRDALITECKRMLTAGKSRIEVAAYLEEVEAWGSQISGVVSFKTALSPSL
jgi:hypothetical protein